MGEPVSSASLSADPTAGPTARAISGRLRAAAWIAALSASLLIFCELIAIDYGLAWSLGSAFGLGTTATLVIGTAGAVGALVVTVLVFRTGLANELALAATPSSTD